MFETRDRRPRRVVRRALGFGIASLAVAGLLSWTPTAASGWNQGAAEGTLWQLMNGARVNNGMAPVQSHGTLVGLARWRSSDMLAKNYFSHTIPGCGCLVYAYYDANGVNYVWGGENIGWNSGRSEAESPVRVHEQFMGSAGHRANVLDPRFTHGGVGAAAADNKMFQGYVQNTRMYTELFSQAGGSAPAPAPAPRPAAQPAAQPAPQPVAGGGGGAATAPAAPAAAKAKPKAKAITITAFARPHSTAGIDGRATIVSAPRDHALLRHLRADELAAARAASLEVSRPMVASVTTAAADASVPMEVSAADAPEPGLLESVIGGILGFLFG